MNKAEKSLRWVVNQIPDFTPKNNEEKCSLQLNFIARLEQRRLNALKPKTPPCARGWQNELLLLRKTEQVHGADWESGKRKRLLFMRKLH